MRVAFLNLGAEERDAPPLVDGSPAGRLARAFEQMVAQPPWAALAEARGLVPWLVTDEAALEAARRSMPLAYAAPEVVRRVHDKAFALACVQRHGLGVDDELSALARAFDPDLLEAGAIEEHVSRWPAWARARVTLKPRFGTSGRGRVAVREGRLDDAARAALSTLRARGGAVLEPFVARTVDVSALWFVPARGAPELLGTTRQQLSTAGVYRGCSARLLDDGGWHADTPIDAAVVRDARVIVAEAQREGWFGFCGVDAFGYDGGARVRTVVELNARFTAGHVALALFARAAAVGGTRLSFSLADDELVRPTIE